MTSTTGEQPVVNQGGAAAGPPFGGVDAASRSWLVDGLLVLQREQRAQHLRQHKQADSLYPSSHIVDVSVVTVPLFDHGQVRIDRFDFTEQ
jgi:hypothetical protein